MTWTEPGTKRVYHVLSIGVPSAALRIVVFRLIYIPAEITEILKHFWKALISRDARETEMFAYFSVLNRHVASSKAGKANSERLYE